MMLSKPAKESDGSGRRIELRDLVLIDTFPIARGGRVYGGGFENRGCYAVGEGAIDDISRSRCQDKKLKKGKKGLTCDL